MKKASSFIIIQAVPIIKSGISSYETKLMCRDGNVERFEKISETIEELIKIDSENNDSKTKDELNRVRKYFLDYYSKMTATNSHFEINAWASSHCKANVPFVGFVDWQTGNVEGYFVFKVMKLITPEELTLLNNFLKDSIAKGETVTHSFN